MKRSTYWIVAKNLKGNLFKVFVTLSELEDNDFWYCFATNRGLSEKLNIERKHISRHISDLKKLGYVKTIEVNKRGNYSEERRIYTIDNSASYNRDFSNLKNLKKTTLV